MLLKRVITLLSAPVILIGCGAGVDERVDVSKISNNSDSAIIASCAMQAADKLVASMPASVGPLDVVGIDILKAVTINDDLNLIDFKVQQYSEKLSRVISETFTDFRCYSTAEAMDAEKERKIERAIAEDEQRHQQAILAARKKAQKDIEAVERAALEAQRAAEIKLIEDEAAAAAAALKAQRAAEIRLLEDKAAKEAALVQAEQWKASKLEAKNRAEEERKYREKYDPIASICLEKAVAEDLVRFKSTQRNSEHYLYKAKDKKVKNFIVAANVIDINFIYTVDTYRLPKRTAQLLNPGKKLYPEWVGGGQTPTGRYKCEF